MDKILISVATGAFIILARTLVAACVRDVGRRLALQFWFIKRVSKLNPIKDPVISGEWRVKWKVRSSNLASEHEASTELFRLFGNVAFSARFDIAGPEIEYLFIGKLSKDRKYLTGTWSDNSGNVAGYHGAYQIRFVSNGSRAVGKWLGFSDAKPIVRADEIEMLR